MAPKLHSTAYWLNEERAKKSTIIMGVVDLKERVRRGREGGGRGTWRASPSRGAPGR